MDKQKLLSLLKKSSLCVLATANLDGKPEAAVMAYAINSNFEIYMFTEPTTRKWQNILRCPRVALVVGGTNDDPEIQLDGTCVGLTDKERTSIPQYVLSVHPEWKDYFSSPTGEWIKVVPSWARYSDFSRDPLKIVEMYL